MSKYRDSITNRKSGGQFFTGKTQIDLVDLVNEYPDGVNITAVHIGEGANGEYAAFSCKEEPGRFAFGGTVFKEIVKGWLQSETESEINSNLADEPCLIIFIEKKNQKGKTYYDVI